MSNIFNDYASREALLRDVESAIAETTDGQGNPAFRLSGGAADELRAQRDELTRRADEEAAARRGLEEKLRAVAKERARESAELERLRAEAGNPDELRATLRRYVDEANAGRVKLAALEAELAPLREENAAYKARETRAAIEAQLVDAAKKLDCCESALRDVRRLAPMFALDASGRAAAKDGRSVEEALRDEIALSPHWLNRSQGSSADAGAPLERGYGDRARFQEALRGTDFAAVIRSAPRETPNPRR